MFRVPMDGGYSGFIATLCDNTANFFKALGSYLILIIGLVLMIVSVYQTVKAFTARSSSSFPMIIGCLLCGGFLAFGGWSFISGDMSMQGSGGSGTGGAIISNTIENLNEGNEPDAVGEFSVSGGNASILGGASASLDVINDSFLLPFGTAVGVAVGVILIVIAVYQISLFFIKHTSISWIKVVALCALGSFLFAANPDDNSGSWVWLRDHAGSALKDSVENITEGNSTDESNGADDSNLDISDWQEGS